MEEINKKVSILNKIGFLIKKNLIYIIITIVLILFVVGIYEFYEYRNIKKIKNFSNIYNEAVENIDIKNHESIELLNEISQVNNGYGLLSAMKIAEIQINENRYEEALSTYNQLLLDEKLDDVYKELILIHASYNLIDYIDYQKIELLIEKIDIEKSIFKSHFYELKFIISINKSDKHELNKLYEYIQSDIEIIDPVKMRVKKVNEYLQFK